MSSPRERTSYASDSRIPGHSDRGRRCRPGQRTRQNLRRRCGRGARGPRGDARREPGPQRVPDAARRTRRGVGLAGGRCVGGQGRQRRIDGRRRRVLRPVAAAVRRGEVLGPDRCRRGPRRVLRRPHHRPGHRCAAAFLADPGGAGAARLRRGPRRRHRRRHRGGAHPARRRQPAAVRAHPGQRGRSADPHAVAGVGRELRRGKQREGGAGVPGRRGRGEPRRRRARAARRPGDRIPCRRRPDAGVGAQEAQVG